MGLTPANPYLWGLAWGLLSPLWLFALQQPSLRCLGLAGLCWGFGYHGTALSWIWGLHPMTWMGIPWGTSLLIAIAGWAIVSLWGAMIPAMVAIAISLLRKHQFHPLVRLWIGVSLWCFLEWLWTQSPLWWTALSYTQSPSNPAILHLGQISGPGLISAVLVFVNGLWAEAYFASLPLSQNLHSRFSWRSVQRLLSLPRSRGLMIGAIALLLGAHCLGFALAQRPLSQAPQDGFKVGIIQGNIPTRIKLTPRGIDQAFKVYQDGYETLSAAGADAVLMPEGTFPTRWSPGASRYQPLLQAIQKSQAIAWVGAFMPTGDRITQSLVTVTPTEPRYSQYNKVKLVPLGEYLPFEQTLGQLISRLTPLSFTMVPGSPDQIMPTPLGQAIVSICYDSAFPQLFRRQTAAGGEFILSVANNDPYSARMMAQHHAQDVMRAIENDRWVARSTNTGFSSVITPHGKTEWRSQRGRYETYLTKLQRRQTQTLYVQWGAWVLALQVLVSVAGMIYCLLNRNVRIKSLTRSKIS